eukprot:COSAG05_NODE_367_length_10739_cov_10.311842_3_plen_595_part_00
MDTESLPPASQPWLLSSVRDLSASDQGLQVWQDKWGRSFPGASGSYADKLRWCRRIGEEAENDPESLLDRSRPCDEGTIIGKTMHESCPDNLTVQLLLKRSQVASLHFDEASATKFLSATPSAVAEPVSDVLSEFKDQLQATSAGLRPSFPFSPVQPPRASRMAEPASASSLLANAGTRAGTRTLRVQHRGGYEAGLLDGSIPQDRIQAYLGWLASEEDTGTDLHADSELICIANVLGVPKDMPNEKLVQDALHALGMRGCIENLRPPLPAEFADQGGGEYLYGLALDLRDTVGQLLHFPSDRHDRGGACVALQLEPAEFEMDSPLTAAEEADRASKATLEATRVRTGKVYLVVDDMHVLWLPACFERENERVRDHVNEGKGECEEIKKRLQKGNTDTGNLKISMFAAELNAIRVGGPHSSTPAEKLCSCVAIALAFAQDTWWMHDNEYPEGVVSVVFELATFLRTVLLKLSDAELELGAVTVSTAAAAATTMDEQQAATTSPPEEEEELMADSRAALYALFEFCKRQFIGTGGGEHGPCVSFNYRPPGPPPASLLQVQQKKRAREKGRRRQGGFEVPDPPPQRHRLLNNTDGR